MAISTYRCAVCGKPAATVVEPPVGPLEFRCADHGESNKRDAGKRLNTNVLLAELAYQLVDSASYLETAIGVLTGGDAAPWLPRSLGRLAGENKALAAIATHYLDNLPKELPVTMPPTASEAKP